MDKALLKKEYRRLLVQAIEGRSGGAALMAVLEEVDFYNSPASAKHHLNVSGGLVLHSLNVARTALELCEKMGKRFQQLHNLDKAAEKLQSAGALGSSAGQAPQPKTFGSEYLFI